MKKSRPAGFDLVSSEARSKVDGWAEKSRGLFTELLEDAPTDMQRELLNRAVAAGHSAAEVHAFADALRGLTDGEAFDKCTIERVLAPDYSIVQLLKAEADPLFAFTLKGGEISPADEGPKLPDPSLPYVPPGAPGRDRPKFDQTDPKIRLRQLGSFDAKEDGALKKTAVQASRELGASPDAPRVSKPQSGSHAPVLPAGSGPILAQDLLNEALHLLGVTYREQPVDGTGQSKLEEVMTQASSALARGLPVPVALGPAPGQDRRLALFLQVQTSGKSRAYQLYDVLSQELAWINEGDLFARTELPFASKHNRRITRIALPMSKSS